MKRAAFLILFALLPGSLSLTNLKAQQEPPAASDDGEAYGSRFFDQLRAIFGRFRDSDLQNAFRQAQPIQCSELVGRTGQWRPVAFFNEDRSLGDWCRESLEAVKGDLAVYTFKGNCSGDQGSIQVATEYPTAQGLEQYQQRRINLDEVDVTMNDPVAVVLNTNTMAYTFELPYLFLTQGADSGRKVYSYIAPNRNSVYATEVSSRWECKAVASKDVTYRFLICRVATLPRGKLRRFEKWEPSFGSSAFFILSDGTEAQTHVNMSFGDADKPAEPDPARPSRPVLKRK